MELPLTSSVARPALQGRYRGWAQVAQGPTCAAPAVCFPGWKLQRRESQSPEAKKEMSLPRKARDPRPRPGSYTNSFYNQRESSEGLEVRRTGF